MARRLDPNSKATCTNLWLRADRFTGKLPIFNEAYYPIGSKAIRRISLAAHKVLGRVRLDIPGPTLVPWGRAEPISLAWKSIESVGRIPGLLGALPTAKAVQIIRHPCGYAASVLRGESQHRFGSSVPASDDYGIFEKLLDTQHAKVYGLSLDALRQQSAEARLAWRWVLFNEQAMSGHSRQCMVRYEDICRAPAVQFRSLFEFCGLDWNRQTEEFLSDSTREKGSGYYGVFRDPAKAASSWQSNLSKQQIDSVLNVVAGTEMGRWYLSGQTGMHV